jgi:deoxyribonuclease-2
VNYIYYDPYWKKFLCEENIQDWLSNLYIGINRTNHHPWTNWIIYNDEPPFIFNKLDSTFHRPRTTAGHCKGVLAWNDVEMSWLIHSVPCFPDFFCPEEASAGLGRVFSEMRYSEEMYGQSFGYFYVSWEKEGKEVARENILELLEHIRMMEPCVYLSKGFWDTPYSQNWKNNPVTTTHHDMHKECMEKKVIGLHRWVGVEGKWEHYGKSPYWEEDFYESLASQKGGCRVESWIRGQKVEDSDFVTNNQMVYSLQLSKTQDSVVFKFTESQDHSKWAISKTDGYRSMNRDLDEGVMEKNWVLIGDLNRMYSQAKRGGGGMLIYDKDLREAWNMLVTKNQC